MRRWNAAAGAVATFLAVVAAVACSDGGKSPSGTDQGTTPAAAAPTPPPSCVRCELSAFNYRLLLFELRLTIEQDSPDLEARLQDLRFLASRADAEGLPEVADALRTHTDALAQALNAGDETAIQSSLVELEQLQARLPE